MRADPPAQTTKPKGKWALSRREELFIHLLLTKPTASQGQCYQEAGFRCANADTASTNAARLLGKDRVARALAAGRQALAERNLVTQDRVLKEFARVGFSDIRKLFESREATPLTPEQLYEQCRNPQWTHPFDQLPPAEQMAWKAAAEIASKAASGGYYLKSPDKLDDETAGAIASIEVTTKNLGEGEVEYVHKVKFVDKLGALNTMAKHLGMLNEDPNRGAGSNLQIGWEE